MPDLPPKIQAAVEKAAGDARRMSFTVCERLVRDYATGSGFGDIDAARIGLTEDISQRIIKYLAPAIAELVREVRMEDARAVCGPCGEGIPICGRKGGMIGDDGVLRSFRYHASQTDGQAQVHVLTCSASGIHDLIDTAKDVQEDRQVQEAGE